MHHMDQLTDEWINRVAYLTFRIALQTSLLNLLTKYDIIFMFLLQVMDHFKPENQIAEFISSELQIHLN